MTLKEIAKKAGVSPSTVSRVINKNAHKCAGKEVQDKIWKIVRETGYIPNKNAQDLRFSNKTISEPPEAVKLACVFARVKDVNDQFFSTLYRMIEQEAYKNRFLIQYSFSFSQLDGSNRQKMLKNIDAEGVIVLGRCNTELIQCLKDRCNHVVCASLNLIDFDVDQVTCSGFKAAMEAVSHLYSLGHRRIGYIGEISNETRYKGYCAKMQELGLTPEQSFIRPTVNSLEGGYQGALELLSGDERPTGIFCCNDITAVGAIGAIKAKNLSVPEDISVISIDNIEMAQYVTPMLTSVGVPLEEMGKMTVLLLKDRIAGGHRLPVNVELPFVLVRRESCAHV